MDLMDLLYKHQIALIRATDQFQRGGGVDPQIAASLSARIDAARLALGVQQYDQVQPA